VDRLINYRDKINEIDLKIVELLEERCELSTLIGNYKRERNLPVQDIKREQVVMSNVNKNIKNPKYKEALEKIFAVIINVSKMFQY
jgi:chorismate mutase